MSNDEAKFTTIKPAAVQLSRKSVTARTPTTRPGPGLAPVIWLGLLLLTGIAAIVIFFLPRWITTSATQAIATTGMPQPPAAAATAVSAPAPGSPWDEAQQSKIRKEAQDILSEMLKLQELLEGIGVKQWAAAEYQQAMQLAEAGDALYRERDFARAREKYQAGLTEFKRLQQSAETTFTDALHKGDQALENGMAAAAQAAFQLALLIKPTDTAAGKGQARAATLDQVLDLLEKGDARSHSEQLAEAVKFYQQALALDPDHKGAAERLAKTRQLITDRDFTAAMSSGYAALASDKLQEARESFQRASRIKPGTAEASDALRQVENKITVVNINKLLALAAQAEHTESWPDAVVAYNQALKLDATLSNAQIGKQNAELRADLDQRLAYAIANPMRLAEQPVYTETSALQKRARSIAAPGARLQGQIATLQRLLVRAQQPLAVTIQSDNITEVTLYKTGRLGQFLSTHIDLTPGLYVVVGKRPGYQDVRVEFTVDPDKPMAPVIVQCENKITF